MLISETFDSKNKRTSRQVLDIISFRRMDYDEEYRELFTMPSCLAKNEFQHLHLYSLPLDKDPHLQDKLAYLEHHKADFVLSKLIESLRNDLQLDLNVFSTSNLEKQSNNFVVNSLMLNVENYLENFEEIPNFAVDKEPLRLSVRECAWNVLQNKPQKKYQ